MLALLAGWAAVGTPSRASRYALLAAAGAAMGLQSIAVRAASGGGVATAYVTGTLTNALATLSTRLAGRADAPHATRDSGRLAGGVWLLYAAGALGGALAELSWHAGALVAPTAIIASIALVALVGSRHPHAR